MCLPNVINLHFLDLCNYKCCYCFIKKHNEMLGFERIKMIVDNINQYFFKNNIVGRINLVGGEIFLCSYLQEIIDYIYSLNIKVSLVTNGSLLTKEFIEKNKTKLETIGISVDSLNENTNMRIGRCSKGKTLNEGELVKICKTIKENGIKLKINLCVSKLNYEENILDFIKLVNPDRFKILQMTIIEGINNKYKNLEISKDDFDSYCKKYKRFNVIVENNEEMKDSYLMIDSKGYFYCDKEKEPIGNVLNESFCELVKKTNLNIENYKKRYV